MSSPAEAPAASAAQRRIDARHTRLLEAIAITIAELTLKKGLPLETALTNAALGNRVHEVFIAYGGKGCERTVRDDIREILGPPVGQMSDHLREAAADVPLKVLCRGARTYSVLGVKDATVRKRLLWRIHAITALFARLTRSSAGSSSPSPSGSRRLTANTLERRVSGALEWALGHAEGQRNNLGNWLAWRCRKIGLAQHEVEAVMERYQGEVCGLGPDPYSRRDAMATVRSVFRCGMVIEDDDDQPEPTRRRTQSVFSFSF
jgi:hypothetical protein